ncbi:MAG: hypothetical protein EAY75_14630 [Bacteroidetes bacterium]|nr:MAG: hypothetical protein EAY75_14630 [Bacteroidota bacterium]
MTSVAATNFKPVKVGGILSISQVKPLPITGRKSETAGSNWQTWVRTEWSVFIKNVNGNTRVAGQLTRIKTGHRAL